jgi:uracil-DNA glycosylase
MNLILPWAWHPELDAEFEQAYFKQLVQFLEIEYQKQIIYPLAPQVFNAFQYCSFAALKVVIVGQDPYHKAGLANGLCFSVNAGVKLPPSLRNIFAEVQSDIGQAPFSADLICWAKQGVLLLNSILTVRAGQAASHKNLGWEKFTDAVLQIINREKQQIVFILWGNYAQQKGKFINPNKHLVLQSAHPSPFSVKNFRHNRHFSQSNAYLEKTNKISILWNC